jgi:hypothetical protein
MTVLREDYVTALDLLAGWDPEWDPGAIKINRVYCMPRVNLLQLLEDNIVGRASLYEIVRQLQSDSVVLPVRMTSKIIDGKKVNIQAHEVLPERATTVRATYND